MVLLLQPIQPIGGVSDFWIMLCYLLQVRVAGMGIAVALTLTEAGRITMTTQCQHIIGGPWGAAFGILLDQSECSMVREQAALVLVNLTSQPMLSGDVSTGADVLYGPVVRNEETQVY